MNVLWLHAKDLEDTTYVRSNSTSFISCFVSFLLKFLKQFMKSCIPVFVHKRKNILYYLLAFCKCLGSSYMTKLIRFLSDEYFYSANYNAIMS